MNNEENQSRILFSLLTIALKDFIKNGDISMSVVINSIENLLLNYLTDGVEIPEEAAIDYISKIEDRLTKRWKDIFSADNNTSN